MPLNTRRSMDPRFPLHHRSVAEGFMAATIQIFRRTGDETDITWSVETGGNVPAMDTLYIGQARLQHNKDWRARFRDAASDPVVQQAIRVQIPLSDCPPVNTSDIIKVLDAPYDRSLEQYTLHVRNSLNSSNAWVHNILCDVDMTFTNPSQITGM